MKEKLGWNHNCYWKQGQHCHMFECYTIHCWYHFNLYVISKNFKRVQMYPAVSEKAKSTSQKSVQIYTSFTALSLRYYLFDVFCFFFFSNLSSTYLNETTFTITSGVSNFNKFSQNVTFYPYFAYEWSL